MSEDLNHSAETEISPEKQQTPERQEPIFTNEQMKSIKEAADKARQEEQRNPEKIADLKEKINQKFGGTQQKKYFVGTKINPDGSVDYSNALEWDRNREKKEFEPVIPRGWTFLKHGTNLVRWGETNPYNSDTIIVRKALSAISKEDFEQDQERGEQYNTTKTYGIVVKPKGMSDDKFKQKNKPFEIRIMFYQDHARHKYDPEYKEGLDKEAMDRIQKYYYANVQGGRHPLIPGKEVLIKLGQIKEDGKDVFYYVPESVSDSYSKESGIEVKQEKHAE